MSDRPATPLPWYPYEYCDGWTAVVDNPPMPRPICVFMDQGTDTFQAVGPEAEKNLRYALHAANELPKLEKKVERLETAQSQLIDERDGAEEALSQAFYLVVGRSPEWSNHFGKNEAIEEIDSAQYVLRAEIERLRAALRKARWHFEEHGFAETGYAIGDIDAALNPKGGTDGEG